MATRFDANTETFETMSLFEMEESQKTLFMVRRLKR